MPVRRAAQDARGDWFGTYEICGVCGWEDDHVQLANPADLVADAYWLKLT